jgi:hypothetical protein
MKRAARLALACSVALSACGDVRVLGRNCLDGDCERGSIGPPPPTGCGAQLQARVVTVPAGEMLERCELFTLDALPGSGEHDPIYLTRAEVFTSPLGQHLDVRLAPQIAGFDDGDVACAELWTRAVSWIPLLTTQGGGGSADLSRAPLVASPSHRLLINQYAANAGDRAAEVSVTLNLACADAPPATVSQAFEFTDREQRDVLPGQRATVTGTCVFDKDVLVSRLYRRTLWITDFSVYRLRGAEPDELVWSSGAEWTLDLEPALPVAAADGFRWQCGYDNATDLPFAIGGDSPDACTLFGFYRLPGGGEDDSLERCTR